MSERSKAQSVPSAEAEVVPAAPDPVAAALPAAEVLRAEATPSSLNDAGVALSETLKTALDRAEPTAEVVPDATATNPPGLNQTVESQAASSKVAPSQAAPSEAVPVPVESAALAHPDGQPSAPGDSSNDDGSSQPEDRTSKDGTSRDNASRDNDPFDTMELDDGVYIPEDEAMPVKPMPVKPVAPSEPDVPPILKSTGVEDHAVTEEGFLEEQTETAEFSGETVHLERGAYNVTGYDAVGRKLARAPDGTEVVIASYQGGAAVTRALYPHPMLPPLLDAGEDKERTLIAHPKISGPSLEDAFKTHDLTAAVRVVLDLARFNRYLSARGFALTGLEPREVLLHPTRLSRLPSVRRIGDTPGAQAPRYGAPERAAGQTVTGLEGVYTLGAMLYHALEGRALSEGELPASFPELPGVPQALTAMLAPPSQRANPQEALELLTKLEGALSKRYRWRVGYSSTVGINADRTTNEDSCGVLQRNAQGDGGVESTLVACVADGMGGMAKGEDASQAAVRGFLDYDLHEISQSAAVDATQQANARVIDALEGKSGGCTFTGVIAEGDRVVLAHVGDTRAYLASDRLVQQLTEDHSMVMMLVKMGVIAPEAAHNHPDSNKVMRALGSNRVLPPDYVDTVEITVQPNSKLVIMSDGVWGPILPADLEAMLLADQSPQDMSDALVRAALKAGSGDNATAMVLIYEEREAL